MVRKFDNAVEFAAKNIELYLVRGLFRHVKSLTRPPALGLHDKDFSWGSELEKR